MTIINSSFMTIITDSAACCRSTCCCQVYFFESFRYYLQQQSHVTSQPTHDITTKTHQTTTITRQITTIICHPHLRQPLLCLSRHSPRHCPVQPLPPGPQPFDLGIRIPCSIARQHRRNRQSNKTLRFLPLPIQCFVTRLNFPAELDQRRSCSRNSAITLSVSAGERLCEGFNSAYLSDDVSKMDSRAWASLDSFFIIVSTRNCWIRVS